MCNVEEKSRISFDHTVKAISFVLILFRLRLGIKREHGNERLLLRSFTI